MAEVPALIEANTVRLQVAAARQEESGHGIARLPKSAMARLGITEGDILEIVGKRSTPARAVLPYPEDEGLEVIRLDGLQVAPCVIFIDEIDSLVPARSSGGGGGEPQVTARVVNTILAEMDGMEEMQSIVVIGATNRPALVDPALLRPGRLDELVYVGTPDEAGREHILKIHTERTPLAKDVDLAKIAKETERFTGADLEDVVRRAGLIAIRTRGEDAKQVTAKDFAAALEDSRATVTPEMEEEYAKLKGELKKRAMEVNPIGFVVPGMLQSTREKKGG